MVSLPKNDNSVINYSKTFVHLRDVCLSDSYVITTFKLQKDSKDIASVIYVTPMV